MPTTKRKSKTKKPKPKKVKKLCQMKTNKASRLRNTPPYVARECRFRVKFGKDLGEDGLPRRYRSRPYRKCSRRTNPPCKIVWKWVPLTAKLT